NVMQQVSELVENRFDFAMREQSRLVAERRREISANAADMGLEAARRIDAGDETIHPGAVALGFAREPVGVKGAEQETAGVAHFVIADVGMPYRHAFAPLHLDAVKFFDDPEHPIHYPLSGEIGAQLFFIEIVELAALELGVIADIPGLEAAAGERFKRLVLAFEGGLGAGLE